MTPDWFRLALDLSHAGEWVGMSYEVRTLDRIVGITVMPPPNPFEDACDLIEDLREEVVKRYGVQMRLL